MPLKGPTVVITQELAKVAIDYMLNSFTLGGRSLEGRLLASRLADECGMPEADAEFERKIRAKITADAAPGEHDTDTPAADPTSTTDSSAEM